MSDLGYIERELKSLPANLQPALQRIFQAIVKEGRFGHPADLEPMQNFSGHWYESETPSIAGTEFTVAHQFGRSPYLLVPVLALDVVGSRIVPLEVTRAADEKRIYLKSTIADAPILFGLEG